MRMSHDDDPTPGSLWCCAPLRHPQAVRTLWAEQR
jgi:hypothetical protein